MQIDSDSFNEATDAAFAVFSYLEATTAIATPPLRKHIGEHKFSEPINVEQIYSALKQQICFPPVQILKRRKDGFFIVISLANVSPCFTPSR
jgi:hypothetical protein